MGCLICGLLLVLAAASLIAGQTTVCHVGYVVDTYCIDRGVLLNNQNTATLTEPYRHSVHCLVDVAQCVFFGYEVLQDPSGGGTLYCRAYMLDEASQNRVIDYFRTVGKCNTCVNKDSTIVDTPRLTLVGTVSDPSANIPTLTLTNIFDEAVGCAAYGGVTVPQTLKCSSGFYTPYYLAHGILMLAAWGVILPMGAYSAAHLKWVEKPNALWFKLHRACQIIGLVVALAGWIIALSVFDVFGPGKVGTAYIHGLIGCIVMSLALLQPINGFLRPHKPEPGEQKTTKRKVWEIVHKVTGWICITCGYVNMFLGYMNLAPKSLHDAMMIAVATIVGTVSLIGFAMWMVSCRQSKKKKEAVDGKELLDESEAPRNKDVADEPPEVFDDNDASATPHPTPHAAPTPNNSNVMS